MKSNKVIAVPTGHEGSEIIVSVSGGKDSTALACAIREAGIKARYAFADTGWEADETYEHLGVIERALGITIDRVQSKHGGMEAIARQKAAFPFRGQRWCTRALKVEPLRAYHDRVAEDTDADTVSVVGIRAEESDERAAMAEFEYDDKWGGYVWRPIQGWSIEDVLSIHHRFGVPVNPLYKRGHSRVGCYPCIFESKESLKLIAEHAPGKIDLIDRLEQEFSADRVRRNAEGISHFKYTTATFFSTHRPGETLPIRKAVAWSKTAKGGKETTQLNLWQPDPSGGCFRWGMCEPPVKHE